MIKNEEPIYEGVYIHTPFCMRKCLYCDFTSYVSTEEQRQIYIDSLLQEIAVRGKNVKPGATIYFGGGTPSVLTIKQLTAVVQALRAAGCWQSPQEATIEVNPGTVDLQKLKALREIGFDRVSIGIQSLNNRELRSVGRIHTAEQALETIKDAQAAGFARINADVMTGLPGQTCGSLQQTLTLLLDLGLSHLSVYSLILEPGTPLEKLVQRGDVILPDEDLDLALYQEAIDILTSSPLERYEISNYAATGQQSQHNLLYWHYRPYLGLGAAAVTFNGKDRFQGNDSLVKYCRQEWGTWERLTPELRLEEYLFMAMRTVRGIDLREAEKQFGCRVWQRYGKQLQPLAEQGLLIYDQMSARLYLTRKGMQFGNEIFEVFVN